MKADRFVWLTCRAALLGFFALLPIGCGSSNVRVYPVSGEVFVNGKPAQGAVVHFHPRDKDKGRPAFAVVQEDGAFQLTTYRKYDGAAVGAYAVTVNWYDERRDEGETIHGPDKLQERYLRPEASGLGATVEPKANALPRFDLK
jgi:hypothetical protein